MRRPHVTGRTQHRVNQVPVAIDRPIQVAPLTVDLQVGVSRPKEFHLRPLSEPDRNLSAHPAPIIPPMPRTQACHKACGSSRIPPGCPVDPHARRMTPPLRSPAITAVSTLLRAAPSLGGASLLSASPFSGLPLCRTPSGPQAGVGQTDPGVTRPTGFDVV